MLACYFILFSVFVWCLYDACKLHVLAYTVSYSTCLCNINEKSIKNMASKLGLCSAHSASQTFSLKPLVTCNLQLLFAKFGHKFNFCLVKGCPGKVQKHQASKVTLSPIAIAKVLTNKVLDLLQPVDLSSNTQSISSKPLVSSDFYTTLPNFP